MIPQTSGRALEVVDLKKSFGGLAVTQSVSLAIRPGERRLIIGPNGAGKTTLFNQISGDMRPNSGQVKLFGSDITQCAPYKRAHLGLSRTYQIITLFTGDTLEHNVTLGLLGLRPSRWNMWRPLSFYGDLATEARRTLDTVGLFAAGVRDVAHGLSAMTGRPELLPQATVPTPRIGVVTQDFADAPEAAGGEALRIAVKAVEAAGATVRSLALPEIVAAAWRAHPTVQEFEAHQALAWEYRVHYDAMAPLLRGRLDKSKGITPAAYDEAIKVASQARHALAKVFEDYDVLLTLSAPGAAPKGLGSTGDARYNRLWTLMGVPCVNIPAHVADGGLPVGVQVIARYGDDAGALAAARFVEEALGRKK